MQTSYSNLRLGIQICNYHMHAPQSLNYDAAVNRTRAPCLYLKNNMAHGLSILKNTW